MPEPYDDEAALEAVLAFLEQPPLAGSDQDRLFGRLLSQVIAAALAEPAQDDDPGQPALVVSDDLVRRLKDLERRRAEAMHPFGDNPEGIGPTLGMDLDKT